MAATAFRMSGGPNESISSRGEAIASTPVLFPEDLNDVRAFYDLGDELGRGQYGVIRLCFEKATGKRYACKIVDKRVAWRDGGRGLMDVKREVRVLQLLAGHPTIVNLKSVHEDDKRVHLILELCEGGDLFDLLCRKRRFSEREAAAILRALLSAVAHFQAHGLMHRDLKPENVLLARRDSLQSVKVVDFGLAAFVKPGTFLSTRAGSAYYVAPEVLRGRYGREADMWSAGVVLYMLLCGVPPFWGDTDEKIFEAVMHGGVDVFGGPWEAISLEAKDLVMKMLCRDPGRRITPEKALEHPWLQQQLSSPSQKPSLSAKHGSFPHNTAAREWHGPVAADARSNASDGSCQSGTLLHARPREAGATGSAAAAAAKRGPADPGKKAGASGDARSGSAQERGEGGVALGQNALMAELEAARRRIHGVHAPDGTNRTAGAPLQPSSLAHSPGSTSSSTSQSGETTLPQARVAGEVVLEVGGVRLRRFKGAGQAFTETAIVPQGAEQVTKEMQEMLAALEEASRKIRGEMLDEVDREEESGSAAIEKKEDLMKAIAKARERVHGLAAVKEEEKAKGADDDDRVLQLLGKLRDKEKKEKTLEEILEEAKRKIHGGPDVQEDKHAMDDRVLRLLGMSNESGSESGVNMVEQVPSSSGATSSVSAASDGGLDERVQRLLGTMMTS